MIMLNLKTSSKFDEGRLGVIVTFLAILELVKESLVDVIQNQSLSKIYISLIKMKYTLENIIECILLVSDEPLAASRIIKIIDDKKHNKKMIEKAITNLNEQYHDKAIHINHVASGYRFQAKTGVELYISSLKKKVQINSQRLF